MGYYGNEELSGKYALAHHGIKGQKWGVRRYQNPDGTYTSEGKVRKRAYRESLKSNTKKNTTSDDEERIRGPLNYDKSGSIRYTIAKKIFPGMMSESGTQDYNRYLRDVNMIEESKNAIDMSNTRHKTDKKLARLEYKKRKKMAKTDLKNAEKMKRMEMTAERLKIKSERAQIKKTRAEAKRMVKELKLQKKRIKADLALAEAKRKSDNSSRNMGDKFVQMMFNKGMDKISKRLLNEMFPDNNNNNS